MPRITSVTAKQLTVADPFQTKERVVARLGSLAAATYAVAGAANNIDEGSALTINITTANIRNGSVLRWRIIDRPTDFLASTGTVAITSNAGSFTITPTEDLLLEGPETFRVQLEKLTGTVIATSAAITINDTSATVLTITPDETTVDEGDTVTFTVNLISGTYPPGTPLYWTASSSQDFVVSSGSFTLSEGTATFSATLQLDLTEEGTETVTVSLRATSIEGAVLVTCDPITVNDTSVPTYAISSNFSAVNEGSPLVFFVTTTGVANGTALYWTASSSDIDPQSGSFEINSGSGTFAVVPSRDATTEGSETFTVSVRTGSTSGTIRATSGTITINDTSLDPTYAISPTSGTVSEGFSRTFTVTTTDVFDGTTLYWTVNTNAGDFGTSSGSFVINSNTGTFSVSPTADRTSEGTETFTVSVRTGSIEGTAVVTTDSFNISDISITPAFTTTPSSITEGNSGSFGVNNLGPAGTYYWTISNGTTTDARFSAVSGSFTTFIGNGSASFSVNPIVNTIVGDSATFQVQIREGSTSGTVLVTSSSVTVNDASIQIQMLTGPGGTVVTTVGEQAGRNIRFTCAANTPSYSYDWEVENITTTYNSQFFNSGDFSNGKGSVSLGPSTVDETAFLGVNGGDGIEGANETFRIIIKYFGQIYGRSEVFTINTDFQ